MMKKILIIDDDRLFSKVLSDYVEENYPDLELECFHDPIKSLTAINADVDLMLIDLEMPGMDGAKLLGYAKQKGVGKEKIIIISGRDADYLHDLFPMGVCLAVLNKHEARQKEVLDMVFGSLQHKCHCDL
jgi:CheY-like chemotaxis protein